MISPFRYEGQEDFSPLTIPNLDLNLSGDSIVERLQFAALDSAEESCFVPHHADEGHGAVLLDEEMSKEVIRVAVPSDGERLADEIAAAEERGRSQGRSEATVEFGRQFAEERAHIVKCCSDFQEVRDAYFADVEGELVKLALEIAKRVLHRHVQVDPIALQGVVVSAISKMMEESGTILRVPYDDAPVWLELLQRQELFSVEVRGEKLLARGECILDTRVGRVEMGISAQLEEIERGFLELQQQRSA